MPIDLYPEAQLRLGPAHGGTQVGGPKRGVIHTTETKDFVPDERLIYSYHLQFKDTKDGPVEIRQHLPFVTAARSLRNEAGGVQTNREGDTCPQLAVVGYSKDSPEWSDQLIEAIARFVVWAEKNLGVPATFPLAFGGSGSWGKKGAGRLTPSQWVEFQGWCGHQDVPENTHWDPGMIPVEKLVAAIATIKDAPVEVFKAWPKKLYRVTTPYSRKSKAVEEIQFQLNRRGFGPIGEDGIYGPVTRATVVAFQAARGLRQDGIVGRNTWTELFRV